MTSELHNVRAPVPLRRIARSLLDAVLPPQCLACPTLVDRPGRLCPDCWTRIDFVSAPYCACCGIAFEYDAGADAICGACLRERPAFDRARAAIRYSDESRDLVLGFKHGDRTHGAAAYGAWMARAGRELCQDADLITPVPLHWTRLFTRRYNQAALLGHAVASATGLAMRPDLLIRKRRTASQGRLSAAARERNLRGAFRVNGRCADDVPGRRILLVDDVLTSGATANACAKLLRRAGAATVDVLVLARAGKPR